MSQPQMVSQDGIALIKRFEGLRVRPLPLPGGAMVVGYGCVVTEAPPGPVSEAQAHAQLVEDLERLAPALADMLLTPVSQAQFDALASFVFSIGIEAFAQSDVLRLLNEGRLLEAAAAMEDWCVSAAASGPPQRLDALVRRRAAERALLLWREGEACAPSPLVQAQRGDGAAASLALPIDQAFTPPAESEAQTPATAPDPVDPWTPLPIAEDTDLSQGERVALAGMAAIGLGLVAFAAFGLAGGDPLLREELALIAAPGFTALAMAGYLAMKHRRS